MPPAAPQSPPPPESRAVADSSTGTPARGSSRQPRGRALVGVALVGVVLLVLALSTRGGGEPPWYPADGWAERTRLSVSEQQIRDGLHDFPVNVNLAGLSPRFWEHVNAGCGDIRVTTSDGQTELPRQIVSCDSATRTGTLWFLAPSLSARSDTRFYLYFGNPDGADYAAGHPYGATALAPFAGGAADRGASNGDLEARP